MRQLLDYMLKGILGDKQYTVLETLDGDIVNFTIQTDDPADIAIVIGKGGRVINSLRSILKVKASIEKKFVNLTVASN